LYIRFSDFYFNRKFTIPRVLQQLNRANNIPSEESEEEDEEEEEEENNEQPQVRFI